MLDQMCPEIVDDEGLFHAIGRQMSIGPHDCCVPIALTVEAVPRRGSIVGLGGVVVTLSMAA